MQRDNLGNYRPVKLLNVYEGFQHKLETVAMALDIEGAYNNAFCSSNNWFGRE